MTDNLLNLWGYYLTLQEDSSKAALSDLFEPAQSDRHVIILADLLDTCRSLGILNENTIGY